MVPRQFVIGLTGRARCGKNAASTLLHQAIPGALEDSFAAPIREMACRILGITLEKLEEVKDQVSPALGVTPRRMMQTLGTEWGRDIIHRDLWVLSLFERNQGVDVLIVPDVRFENEAAAIRACGGLIIHMHRPGNPSVEEHVSEAGVIRRDRDALILNSGSLEDLRQAALNCMPDRIYWSADKV